MWEFHLQLRFQFYSENTTVIVLPKWAVVERRQIQDTSIEGLLHTLQSLLILQLHIGMLPSLEIPNVDATTRLTTDFGQDKKSAGRNEESPLEQRKSNHEPCLSGSHPLRTD